MQPTITISIEEGLDFILGHFLTRSGVNIPRSEELSLWPRTISTKATGNKQILVSSRTEALARFAAANYKDCKISAYPLNVLENPFKVQSYLGLTHVTPTDIIIMMDLDRNNFKTDRAFNLALTQVLRNINDKLGVTPTVIGSGRGYHIVQSLNSNGIILENVKEFADTPDISLRFLRFAESYLSLNRSDLAHNTTVSFNNCMLRVPGSINSKNGETVRVIQKWDDKRPEINYMLLAFERYLINEKYQELLKAQKRRKVQPTNFNGSNSEIYWIEKLLSTPLEDYRKYCIWRILAPYLLNKRGLSKHEIVSIIGEWLDRCSRVRRLDFNVSQKIREGIDGPTEGYMPIAFDKLKDENPELHLIIREI